MSPDTAESQPDAPRRATVERATNETRIRVELDLDATEPRSFDTGLGFLDHMLESLTRHAGIALSISCDGDLGVDDHHTAEDCALAIGAALNDALGDRAGIRRFGDGTVPMDESLARAAIDLSGRPYAVIECGFARPMIGEIATENIEHFFESLAMASRMALHVDLVRGKNDHHRAEAAFKAVAVALRDAIERRGTGIPSTKGVL